MINNVDKKLKLPKLYQNRNRCIIFNFNIYIKGWTLHNILDGHKFLINKQKNFKENNGKLTHSIFCKLLFVIILFFIHLHFFL